MSRHEFTIYSDGADAGTPLVLFHGFRDEGTAIRREMSERECRPCVLAAVRVQDWEQTLSPWKAPRVFSKADDFGDGADVYLRELTGEILPELRRRSGAGGPCIIAGYSRGSQVERSDSLCEIRASSLSMAL